MADKRLHSLSYNNHNLSFLTVFFQRWEPMIAENNGHMAKNNDPRGKIRGVLQIIMNGAHNPLTRSICCLLAPLPLQVQKCTKHNWPLILIRHNTGECWSGSILSPLGEEEGFSLLKQIGLSLWRLLFAFLWIIWGGLGFWECNYFIYLFISFCILVQLNRLGPSFLRWANFVTM